MNKCNFCKVFCGNKWCPYHKVNNSKISNLEKKVDSLEKDVIDLMQENDELTDKVRKLKRGVNEQN